MLHLQLMRREMDFKWLSRNGTNGLFELAEQKCSCTMFAALSTDAQLNAFQSAVSAALTAQAQKNTIGTAGT